MTDTVGAQIEAQAPNPFVRLAMRLGALLEGGSLGPGPFGVGDQGHSHGPFQINLPYHPGVTALQAENPAFAVRYMLPSYISAAAQIPTSVWNANPELAAEKTARAAERPAQDYFASRGQSTVDQLWRQASGKGPSPGAAQLAAAGGTPSTGTTSPTGSSGGGGCNAPGGLSAVIDAPGWVKYFFCKLEQDAKPALFEATAVIAGAGLVTLGLWRTVSRTQTYRTAKTQLGNVGQAAAMGAMA